MSELEFAPLRLRRKEERRLRKGHLWVFSNEVDVKATPLTDLEPGQPVEVQDHQGRALGTGYANPHSLICARLVSRSRQHPFGSSLIVHRLNLALSLRRRLFVTPHYRLVHGEGDGLPGLVVDRFDDVLVVQTTTAGMERMLEAIVTALHRVVAPRAIYLRNDNPIRELEHLPLYAEPALGEVPEEVEVVEHGVAFVTPLIKGQKTGWFYDQADNRGSVGRYVQGSHVLDVFSYTGAWAMHAALAGAESVLCVDDAVHARAWVDANARRHGLEGRVETMVADAFQALRSLRESRRRFDVVILDPPAFIKRKKDMDAGLEAYRRLNQMAIQVADRDAILISSSCSYHLARSTLVQQIYDAARHLDRGMQVVAHGHQSVDHPNHPAIPETAYLKTVFARVAA